MIPTTSNAGQRKEKKLSAFFKSILKIVTHYETPKVVRFESKWIASLSMIVKMTLAVSCIYLMCQRNSYQIFDRSPISAVTIRVKQSTFCVSNNDMIGSNLERFRCVQSSFDVNDFILPAIENSAVTITTRIKETEYVLRSCDSSAINITQHRCSHAAKCILPPFYRDIYKNLSGEQTFPLCWFELPTIYERENSQALNYIIFIKHFVEFPLLGLIRHNLANDIIEHPDLENCEYDPKTNPLCPKFRISKILTLVEKDPTEYERMIFYGSLIEIKISWKCNLDRSLEYCEPNYQFQRLDIKPYEENSFEPGSTFFTLKHFFQPKDRELHRIHTQVYNLHIYVSVTGEAGKFDLFQTTTSIGSFLGIFGTGTIVCDLIAAFFTNLKHVKYDLRR